MLLFLRPIQSNRLTQAFGENSVCARCMPGGFPIRPFIVVNKIGGTCPQGSKDFYRLLGMKGHNGGDFSAWSGEPTYHCGLFRGVAQIPKKRQDGSLDLDGGLNIISLEPLVECTDGCAAGTMHYILIRYAHGTPIAKDGNTVTPGDHIMNAGSIGSSSGVHVHWAPKWCDKDGVILHTNNGYEGAFNYNPRFQNTFILDYIKTELASHDTTDPIPPHPSLPDTAPAPAALSTLQIISKIIFLIASGIAKLIHTPNSA